MSNPVATDPVMDSPQPPGHAAAPPSVPAVALPSGFWLNDLNRAARSKRAWLWEGYLMPGGVTLLTSLWKSGKTTVLALLLARMKTGGQLLGRPVAAGKAVVVSEETPQHWYERGEKLALGDNACFLCRPFQAAPRQEHWLALVDGLVQLHREHGLALVVIDSLAAFLPLHAESNATCMMEALTPLHRLTALGLSVLLLHHPRKEDSAPGLAARGTGTLSAFVDILLEMDGYRRGLPADRRRRLRGYSRSEETPRHRVIELNPEGTDYAVLDAVQAEEFSHSWQTLCLVLEAAGRGLTRREILQEWLADREAPSPATLWKWLERGVSQGLVYQEGTGRKNDPFRYGLTRA